MKDSSTLYLGDQNFVPARIDILRERLAAKLSHVSAPVIVHIDSFEFIVYDDTGHSGSLSARAGQSIFLPNQSTTIFVPQSIVVGIARGWTDRTVICAISGRANGHVFEVNEYKNVAPQEIARGFEDVLTTAVDKAVEQILAQSSSK